MKEFIINYGVKIFGFIPILLIILSSYYIFIKEDQDFLNPNAKKYLSINIFSCFFSLLLIPIFRLLKADDAKIWVFVIFFIINSICFYLIIKIYKKNLIKK